MKVVNLSRRPFVNRRPVTRASIALWVVGGVLLLVNLWLYGEHARGSSVEREKLDLVGRQIEEELERLDRYADDLKTVRLGRSNARARALNRLIHKRTFPWSGLFDDLERVLPTDVFLDGVSPEIKKSDKKRTVRTRRRSLTPAEARRLAQARARGETVETPEQETPEDDDVVLAQQDRVVLNLNGTAKSEDAMFELVTNLYGDPSFEEPFLGRENADIPGQVKFSVRVVYRTRVLQDEEPEQDVMLADAGVDTEDGVDAEGGRAVESQEDGDASPMEEPIEVVEARGEQVPDDAPPAEGSLDSRRATDDQRAARIDRRGQVVDTPRRNPTTRRQISEDEMAERQAMAERTRQEVARQRSQPAGGGVSVLGVPQTAPPAAETSRRSGSSRVSVAPPTRDRETSRPSTSRETEPTADRPSADERPPESVQPPASSTPRLRGNR